MLMSRERTVASHSHEDVREPIDLDRELAVIAVQGRDLAEEKSTTYNGLVWEEAMALSGHMLAMEHPLNLRRRLGRYAVGLHDRKDGGYERRISTPLLLVTERFRADEEPHIEGWQFMTHAQLDYYGARYRGWEPIALHLIKHTRGLGEDDPASEERRVLDLQKKRNNGKVEMRFSPFGVTDSNHPDLLDIYARIRMARRDLGDKKAK
jgi:hypothetical protein